MCITCCPLFLVFTAAYYCLRRVDSVCPSVCVIGGARSACGTTTGWTFEPRGRISNSTGPLRYRCKRSFLVHFGDCADAHRLEATLLMGPRCCHPYTYAPKGWANGTCCNSAAGVRVTHGRLLSTSVKKRHTLPSTTYNHHQCTISLAKPHIPLTYSSRLYLRAQLAPSSIPSRRDHPIHKFLKPDSLAARLIHLEAALETTIDGRASGGSSMKQLTQQLLLESRGLRSYSYLNIGTDTARIGRKFV